jgi:hypothetical protein
MAGIVAWRGGEQVYPLVGPGRIGHNQKGPSVPRQSQPVAPGNPAFEMYYPMSNFVPWRDSAWAVLVERVRVLADRCDVVTT